MIMTTVTVEKDVTIHPRPSSCTPRLSMGLYGVGSTIYFSIPIQYTFICYTFVASGPSWNFDATVERNIVSGAGTCHTLPDWKSLVLSDNHRIACPGLLRTGCVSTRGGFWLDQYADLLCWLLQQQQPPPPMAGACRLPSASFSMTDAPPSTCELSTSLFLMSLTKEKKALSMLMLDLADTSRKGIPSSSARACACSVETTRFSCCMSHLFPIRILLTPLGACSSTFEYHARISAGQCMVC